MKKLLLTTLLVMTAAAITAKTKEIKVNTPHDFIKAIGSNRVIIVSGVLNLSDILQSNEKSAKAGLANIDEYEDPTATISREKMFDGYQLVINQCKNLTIRGNSSAALIVSPRYSYILSFRNSQDIEITNLTIGHTDEGYCMGGVLEFNNCEDIKIDRCDLYGCGTEGITAQKTKELDCTNTIIRDCSYGIMTIHDSFNTKFTDCDFYRCREYGLISLLRAVNTSFVRCRFSQNQGQLFTTNGNNISLRNCEIHHTGPLGDIDINKYTTTTYKRDNQELPTRNIGPTDRANLAPSKQQDTQNNYTTTQPQPKQTKLWGETLEKLWTNPTTSFQLPKAAKPQIKEMMMEFCRVWPGLEGSPQRTLLKLQNTPKHFEQYNADGPERPVNHNKPHKLFSNDETMETIEYDNQTGFLIATIPNYYLSAALWNRGNGHKLLVINIQYAPESLNQQITVAYDYNPATRNLTPDAKIAARITEGGKAISTLPRYGKDILLAKGADEDNPTYYLLRWNGQGFNAPIKISHEKAMSIAEE